MTSTLAAAVAAYGLPTSHRFPDAPLTNNEFDALLHQCEHHRVVGFLGTAVRDGAFPVTEVQRDGVEHQWQGWLAHAVRVEQLVLESLDALGAAGIRALVLKGVALAHTTYPDPAQRVFGDADLLLDASHFTRGANLLIEKLDARRPIPELRAGFDDRFGKEIMLDVRDLELDLHRTFLDGALGQLIPLPDLMTEPVPCTIGDRTVFTLDRTSALLHTAYAALFGDDPPRLSSMRDFAMLMPRDNTGFHHVCATASQWRASAVLAGATHLTVKQLALRDSSPLAPWADTYRPNRLDRALLHAHTGPGRGYTRQAAALIVVPGFGARLAYATALTFPDRAYLDARQIGTFGLAQRARNKLRRRQHR